jgi:hypothetical protein
MRSGLPQSVVERVRDTKVGPQSLFPCGSFCVCARPLVLTWAVRKGCRRLRATAMSEPPARGLTGRREYRAPIGRQQARERRKPERVSVPGLDCGGCRFL